MTPDQFAARVVGTPWARHRADWHAMNCFGLLILFFRHVHGVDLGALPETDIATGFARATGWEICEPQTGATAWMSWQTGMPTHCGVVLPGEMLLHAEGSEDHPGSVRVTRLAFVRRVYGEILFYRRKPC
jgi:hypothetical protein